MTRIPTIVRVYSEINDVCNAKFRNFGPMGCGWKVFWRLYTFANHIRISFLYQMSHYSSNFVDWFRKAMRLLSNHIGKLCGL